MNAIIAMMHFAATAVLLKNVFYIVAHIDHREWVGRRKAQFAALTISHALVIAGAFSILFGLALDGVYIGQTLLLAGVAGWAAIQPKEPLT